MDLPDIELERCQHLCDYRNLKEICRHVVKKYVSAMGCSTGQQDNVMGVNGMAES